MKKLLVLLFLVVLLVGTVSAMEWDNVKEYNPETKEVTIINALGIPLIEKDIAKIRLDTPLRNKVGVGYVMVWEKKITMFEDYSNFLQEMEYYNIRDGMKPIEIEVDIKYKVITINKGINRICNIDNKTLIETCKNIPFENEIITYKDYNGKDMLEGNITLSGWTTTKQGDKIEWIYTYGGIRADFWAVWTAGLNTNLIVYHALNESAGTTMSDSHSFNYDGTAVNIEDADWVVGLLGNALLFDGINEYGNLSYTSGFTSSFNDVSFSMSFWVYPTDALSSAGEYEIFSWGGQATDEYRTYWYDGDLYFKTHMNASGWLGSSYTINLNADTWYHIVATFDKSTSNASLYLDGTLINSATAYPIDQPNSVNSFTIGARNTGANHFNGTMDEVGFWNRTLTSVEVTQLYNGGTGITYTSVFNTAPTVTLNTPIDTANLTSQTVIFNCTVSDDSVVQNVSLIINATYNITNGTVSNNTPIINTVPLTDGFYNWTCEGCDDEDSCTNATTRNFTIDTAPTINVISPGFNNSNYTTNTIYFNATNSLPIDKWIVNYNGTNVTLSAINTSLIVEDGNHRLFLYGNNSVSGIFGLNDSVYFNVDVTSPNITIHYPISTINFHEVNTNLSLNYTISDLNIDSCWYDYSGTNISLNCSTNSSFNVTNADNKNITIYANDTFGNNNSATVSWDYNVFFFNQTFNNPTIEGNTETFRADVRLGSGITLDEVLFFYNDSVSIGESFTLGDNTILRLPNFIIPNVEADVNLSIIWALGLSIGSQVNLTSVNQTVLNLGIDNCSTFTNNFYNFSLLDEEFQTTLSVGTVIETAFNIYNSERSKIVVNFSQQFNGTNPVTICLSLNLSNITFGLVYDVVVKYEATNHTIEYYNILNSTLNNQTGFQNITLYDLLTEDSTDFQVTFKGADFLPIENALIFINRQYIAENIFKTVELPKTDSNGQTIVHLVRNDIIYNIVVVSNGTVIATFNNVVAFCEDFTIGNCKLNLNAFESSTAVFDYNNTVGLIFTNPSYDNTTRIVSFAFLTADGTVQDVSLNISRNNIFGNTSVCNNSVTSSGGTLSCTIPGSVDDSTLIFKVFLNEELVIKDYLIVDSNAYGEMGYFIFFILMLTIVLMFIQSKSIMLIGIVLGFGASLVLGIIQGKFIGLGSAGIWLIVVVAIMLWKLNKERSE